MQEHEGEFLLFPGIREALHRFAAGGIQVAVASSNSRANVERVLGPDSARLMTHFACGISMFGKAAKLRQLVRQSNIPQTLAIYIGDEVRDAEAAAKAGIKFGAVTWGQHSQEILSRQNPAEIFLTVRELADKLG
jgi:phosphoglycolate phosphatase